MFQNYNITDTTRALVYPSLAPLSATSPKVTTVLELVYLSNHVSTLLLPISHDFLIKHT